PAILSAAVWRMAWAHAQLAADADSQAGPDPVPDLPPPDADGCLLHSVRSCHPVLDAGSSTRHGSPGAGCEDSPAPAWRRSSAARHADRMPTSARPGREV